MPGSLLSIMVRRLRLVVPVGRGQTAKSPCPGRSPINAVEGEIHGRGGREVWQCLPRCSPAAFVAHSCGLATTVLG